MMEHDTPFMYNYAKVANNINPKLPRSIAVLSLDDGKFTLKINLCAAQKDSPLQGDLCRVLKERAFNIREEFSTPKGKSPKELKVFPIRAVTCLIDEFKGAAAIINKECKKLTDEGIYYWRRINGDGNCYYRSVAYAYFELVVKKGADHIQSLIKLLEASKTGEEPLISLKENPLIADELINGIKEVYKIRRESSMAIALQELFLNFTKFDFDMAAILFLKTLATNLLKSEYVDTVNEIPIKDIIETNYNMNVKDYAQQNILALYQCAKEFVLLLVPLALRVNVFIHPINVQAEKGTDVQEYQATSPEFSFKRDDLLNFSDKTIHLLLLPGHYEVLYKEKDYFKYDDRLYEYLKVL